MLTRSEMVRWVSAWRTSLTFPRRINMPRVKLRFAKPQVHLHPVQWLRTLWKDARALPPMDFYRQWRKSATQLRVVIDEKLARTSKLRAELKNCGASPEVIEEYVQLNESLLGASWSVQHIAVGEYLGGGWG